MSIWVFSDSHFYHRNIVKYCNRPSNHDSLMWDALARVSSSDILIHLGDVVLGRRELTERVCEHLPGAQRILVCGNHDKKRTRACNSWSAVVTAERQPLVLLWEGVTVYMAHRPQHVPHVPGAIVIHGHIHNKGKKIQWHESCMVVNACVEHWDYGPVSLDYLVRRFKEGESERWIPGGAFIT